MWRLQRSSFLQNAEGEGVALSKQILRHQDHSGAFRPRCSEAGWKVTSNYAGTPDLDTA